MSSFSTLQTCSHLLGRLIKCGSISQPAQPDTPQYGERSTIGSPCISTDSICRAIKADRGSDPMGVRHFHPTVLGRISGKALVGRLAG